MWWILHFGLRGRQEHPDMNLKRMTSSFVKTTTADARADQNPIRRLVHKACVWPPCCDILGVVTKRAQHVEPSNVALCCVGMLRSFGRGLWRRTEIILLNCRYLNPLILRARVLSVQGLESGQKLVWPKCNLSILFDFFMRRSYHGNHLAVKKFWAPFNNLRSPAERQGYEKLVYRLIRFVLLHGSL